MKKTKCKIVKFSYILAVDENGDSHQIENYPFSTKGEVLQYEEVEGILTSEWKQDKYTDGTHARSESKHTSFKIIGKLS